MNNSLGLKAAAVAPSSPVGPELASAFAKLFDTKILHIRTELDGSFVNGALSVILPVRTRIPTANTPNSAIFEHREVTGHRINSDQLNILKSCSKWDVRLLEALYIKKK